MNNEQDQIKNERILIDILLMHPHGLSLHDLNESLKSQLDMPLSDVMDVLRGAFSKSLIRREEGFYFTSELGASGSSSEQLQVKSRIDKFNERYAPRMPISKDTKRKLLLASGELPSDDTDTPEGVEEVEPTPPVQVPSHKVEKISDISAFVDVPQPAWRPNTPSKIGTSPIGLLNAASSRGIVAALFHEHRHKPLTLSEVLDCLPQMNSAIIRRLLLELAKAKFSCAEDKLLRSFLHRAGRGKTSTYQWSTSFSLPFTGASVSWTPRVGESESYKERMQILAEIEKMCVDAVVAADVLNRAISTQFATLAGLTVKIKQARELIRAELS